MTRYKRVKTISELLQRTFVFSNDGNSLVARVLLLQKAFGPNVSQATLQCLTKCYYLRVCNAVNPANIDLFKINDKNTKEKCKICSKLPIRTPE